MRSISLTTNEEGRLDPAPIPPGKNELQAFAGLPIAPGSNEIGEFAEPLAVPGPGDPEVLPLETRPPSPRPTTPTNTQTIAGAACDVKMSCDTR